MSSFERKQLIGKLIHEGGSVSVAWLAKRLDCSVATVRRDLSELEAEGKVRRTHGGAVLPAHLAVEPAFTEKRSRSESQKSAIGRRVARELPEGITVYVDSGTTCLQAGTALLERGKNRIYTNSIPLLVAGCRYPGRVTAIGGDIRKISQALVGGLGQSWMRQLRFDLTLMGTSAIREDGEVLTTELREAEMKSLAVARSSSAWLLADADKFKGTASVKYADIAQFTTLYTDTRAAAARMTSFQREHKLRVVRCA